MGRPKGSKNKVPSRSKDVQARAKALTSVELWTQRNPAKEPSIEVGSTVCYCARVGCSEYRRLVPFFKYCTVCGDRLFQRKACCGAESSDRTNFCGGCGVNRQDWERLYGSKAG